MKPQHFHLIVSFGLAALSARLAIAEHYGSAGFIGLGALVALLYWKSSRSGMID